MTGLNKGADQYLLSSLDNALDILNELATRPDMGITELGNRLGLGKASVFRTLYTLERKGFVRKTADARYALGMRLVILGKIAYDQTDGYSVPHHVLEDLAEKTNVTVYLAVLTDSCDMFFVDSAFGNALLQARVKSGSRYPAYCSGGGKVLLSYLLGTDREPLLEQIPLLPRTPTSITSVNALRDALLETRRQGYGVDNGERESELICYGMPVLSPEGTCMCSLSISGPRQTMLQNQERFLSLLKESVLELTACPDFLQQYISHYTDILRM